MNFFNYIIYFYLLSTSDNISNDIVCRKASRFAMAQFSKYCLILDTKSTKEKCDMFTSETFCYKD